MEDNGQLKFDPTDFESYSWSFAVMNLTSKQPVQPSTAIHVLEIGERGLTLAFPTRACATGHQLQIKAEVSIPSKEPVRMECTAKVERMEHLDSTEDLVEIAFVQIDEAAWAEIRGVVADRQAAILDFFRSVKGEE